MFIPKRNHEGKELNLPMTGSATLTKYTVCKMTSGYLADGASGDDEVVYIALETKTAATTNGETYCLVLKVDNTIEFEALTSITPVQATHVGNSYDLSAAGTVNLGATTDKVFLIDSIVNAADKLVRGHFNRPAMA